MPKVPNSNVVPLQAPGQLSGPPPSPTDFAMAASMMHSEGRLFTQNDPGQGQWSNLNPDEQKSLEEKSAKVFPDQYDSKQDIQNLIDKHGAIETQDDSPQMKSFLKNLPSEYEKFNYKDDPSRTKMIRRKEALTS